MIEGILGAILSCCAIAFLLYGHKTYATNMSHKAKLIFSIGVPVLLCLLGAFGMFAFSDRFRSEPIYYNRLKPPLIRPVTIHSPQNFVKSIDHIFERKK